MLVVDFADDLFDDVLDRDQAVGAAYSSTTSARWMREACIWANRSIARIDGGTNSSCG